MLELIHIKKDYYVDKKPYTALKDISLAFTDKGFVSILGPSGCGKTTMLNIIGGLDHYTEGDLLIDNKSTKDFKDAEWDAYRNERVGFVFQSYNLIPHQTILSNVETGLMLNGVNHAERDERALKALENVGLKEMAKKKPNQLSGGQMQRVALARALVNNPKIVLADEPTGALDSVTSKQVMELLKEASKTRLVIMVTHNQELAYEYSDRIIRMKDGAIESDSSPVPIKTATNSIKEINKKTSMSFMTALKSSWSNVRTKKGRTILTAIASSIGIIGVALVLAVSNGFSVYVDKVETAVAGTVPISISPITYSYKQIENKNEYEQYPDEQEVKVYDSTSTYSTIHKNNFTADYRDYISKTIDKGLASSILYNKENFSFNLMTDDPAGHGVIEVDQYASAGMTGSAIGSVTGLPTTIFHELYGPTKEISKWYDCIAGKMPSRKDEIVLITDSYNRVEKKTLTELGILSSVDDKKTISFDDILYNENTGKGKIYKAYRNSDIYKDVPFHSDDGRQVDSYEITGYTLEKGIYQVTVKDAKATIRYFEYKPKGDTVFNDDEKYNPVKLKVVGVLRPKKDAYISLMPSSLGYISELKDYLADDGRSASYEPNEELRKRLTETHHNLELAARGNVCFIRNIDPTTGKPTKDDGIVKLNTFFEKYSKALNLSNIIQNKGEMTDQEKSTLALMVSEFPSEMEKCFNYYNYYGISNDKGGTSLSYWTGSSYSFLKNCKKVGADMLQSQVSLPSTSEDVESSGLALVLKLTDNSFWNDINNPSRSTWCAMDFLALEKGFSLITSILIFPAALTTKKELTSYLDKYNEGKVDSDQIAYNDVMSTFTDSLGTMIQMISVVLIVFASISLVVSSIMTGIITYVSVVERTKEIGILRACGARKKDVGRLFQAECVIIGAMAGVIGVGVSWIACFPISAIIDHLFPGNGLNSIASLSPWHGLMLIAIAIVLAFISGLIPARIAAKKDPVTALRTE